MKVLSYLFAIALVCGFTGFAHADSVDFHMGVLDPPLHGEPITGSGPFSVSFGACPAGFNYQGCFVGTNDTDKTFKSLQLIFPNTPALNSQDANCDTSLPNSIFTSESCSLSSDGKNYILDFFGGSGLEPCETFVIVEDGVDPSSFPRGTGTFSTTLPTPEPGTMMLLSTGMSALGMVGMRRRRSSTHRSSAS